MDKADITIIGAGVVGLAIAEKLSLQFDKKEIVVLECHDSFGQEASSRNSEVIHAGIYYPTNSLKAQLCVEGNRRLYELCENQGIPFRKIGKLIIANNEKETEKIHELHKSGIENGVTGLSLLNKSKINELEPAINADVALYSEQTGIIDSHKLMKYFEKKSEESGVIISYNCTVVALNKVNSGFEIIIKESQDEIMKLHSNMVINCAGIHADTIAQLAGINIDRNNYRIHPCKGEYFSVSNKYKNKLKHLVYPAPTEISLGIHTVIDLNDSVKLGPNAFYCNTVNYDVDPSHKKEFYKSAKAYLPFLNEEDISPAMAGVRAKIQKKGDSFKDFIIREESDKNLSGLINLIGIESPGLTSSSAIADYVAKIIRTCL